MQSRTISSTEIGTYLSFLYALYKIKSCGFDATKVVCSEDILTRSNGRKRLPDHNDVQGRGLTPQSFGSDVLIIGFTDSAKNIYP